MLVRALVELHDSSSRRGRASQIEAHRAVRTTAQALHVSLQLCGLNQLVPLWNGG